MTFSLSPFVSIAEGVFVAVAEPTGVNIGLIVGSAGALIVDTGSSPSQGRAILAAARHAAGPVPVTHVVVTHHHSDHLFGLSGFEGVESIGHESLASDLAAFPPTDVELAELDVARDDIILPGRSISLATTIALGDCHAEIVHFGLGHSSSDVVVIIPELGVVFAGDLLESAAKPSIGVDSHLKQWPSTLDGTLGTLRRDSVVVPGHGPTMGHQDAVLQRAELKYLWDQAEMLLRRGVAVEDAWGAAKQWLWDEASTRAALPEVYRQLARAGVTAAPASMRRLPLTPL